MPVRDRESSGIDSEQLGKEIKQTESLNVPGKELDKSPRGAALLHCDATRCACVTYDATLGAA